MQGEQCFGQTLSECRLWVAGGVIFQQSTIERATSGHQTKGRGGSRVCPCLRPPALSPALASPWTLFTHAGRPVRPRSRNCVYNQARMPQAGPRATIFTFSSRGAGVSLVQGSPALLNTLDLPGGGRQVKEGAVRLSEPLVGRYIEPKWTGSSGSGEQGI